MWASIAWKPPAPQPSTGKEQIRSTPALITKRVDTAKAPVKEGLQFLITLSKQAKLQVYIPYAARQAIASAVEGVTLMDIPKATHTKTGWAIFPADKKFRKRLMDPESWEKKISVVGGTSAALPETWHNYAVPHVATSYKSINGDMIQTTLEIVVEEVASQTGKRPVSCRPLRHGPDAYCDMTWVISFKEPVGHFQLFCTSNRFSKIKKRSRFKDITLDARATATPHSVQEGHDAPNAG